MPRINSEKMKWFVRSNEEAMDSQTTAFDDWPSKPIGAVGEKDDTE